VGGLDGSLFGYSVEQKKWSRLADRGRASLTSITYAPEEDALYALGMGQDGPGRTVVYRFDGEGKPAGRVVLSRQVPTHPHDRPNGGPQIFAVGRQLAVLTPPMVDVMTNPDGPEEPLCYLVDPRTGRVTYHGPMRVHAAARAEPMGAAELDALWQTLRGADGDTADKLMWKLASGGEQTVQYLRAKLRPAAPPAAARLRELVAMLGADDAEAREEASHELRQGGVGARAELKRALEEDLAPETRARLATVLARIASDEEAKSARRGEDPGPDAARWDDEPRLRREHRGLAVLARIGSPEALRCLREVAAGAVASPRTVQAQAVLRRTGGDGAGVEAPLGPR
jgi:hypothetical protein